MSTTMSTSSVEELITNTKHNNVNVNNKYLINVNNVRLIADKLSTALNDKKSYDYFMKIAWHLPEYKIWNNLEYSAKGKDPRKLFTWLCKQDMACK